MSVSWQPIVPGTFFLHKVLSEAFLTRWENTNSAQRALGSASGLGAHALVPVEVCIQIDRVALVAGFVLVAVLALLNQMVVERRYFYDLFTLPACRQHWALFPVVNVDGLLIEIIVESAAEVANFFVELLLTVVLLLLVLRFIHVVVIAVTISCSSWLLLLVLIHLRLLLLHRRSALLGRSLLNLSFLARALCTSHGAARVDVRLDNFLSLFIRCLCLEVTTANLS